jgi:hypothetical protein
VIQQAQLQSPTLKHGSTAHVSIQREKEKETIRIEKDVKIVHYESGLFFEKKK